MERGHSDGISVPGIEKTQGKKRGGWEKERIRVSITRDRFHAGHRKEVRRKIYKLSVAGDVVWRMC